jgi:hypothetical protein
MHFPVAVFFAFTSSVVPTVTIFEENESVMESMQAQIMNPKRPCSNIPIAWCKPAGFIDTLRHFVYNQWVGPDLLPRTIDDSPFPPSSLNFAPAPPKPPTARADAQEWTFAEQRAARHEMDEGRLSYPEHTPAPPETAKPSPVPSPSPWRWRLFDSDLLVI